VLCVAFHPQNSQILACGSADFKCTVFSVFSSDVDAGPDGSQFGSPVEFGDTYAEFTSLGWVNAVAWSPSGSVLAFAGHDSSIHFVTFGDSGPVCRVTRFKDLPLCALYFPSESLLVGGGHDFNPMMFTGGSSAGAEWTSLGFLDRKKADEAKASTSGVAAARALFQNKSTRGQDAGAEGDTLWTKHESCIRSVTRMAGSRIATSALDGRLVVWDLAQADVGVSMASLGI
jgi:actin related protein 2/3 complex subunit 1A/1B